MSLRSAGNPPAVIVGFELNGLGVSRALAAHGIECIGLAGPFWSPALKTNTCTVIQCEEWSQEAVLQKLVEIAETRKQKMPLLITKEAAVRWISDARERLVEFYEMCLPENPAVDALLDKATFARLAAREGWPVPRTWRIQSREELLDAVGEVPFPCILKPEVHTHLFGERSPQKAFKVSSADELLRIHQMAAQWTQGFVVQEWIQGGDDRIAFCLTYVSRDGDSQTFFSGRKLRQFPPECGNTALCEPAPASWTEPIRALTEQIWRSVGFKGLGSVEYKMRLNSDQPVIMEPTVGRTNYQNELAVLNGVNLPLIAYCDLAGLPGPTLDPRTRHCKLVDGMRELKSARYYFRNGTLTRRRWLRDRGGRSRYMTLRVNDLGPFVASATESLQSLAGTFVERVLGRGVKLKLKGAFQWGARFSRRWMIATRIGVTRR